MKLEREGKSAISPALDSQIRTAINSLKSYGPCSFASLTNEAGSYIQTAGGRVTCMVERFDISSGERVRAFHDKPSPLFPDGTILAFGGGELRMMSDEWFSADTVVELFLCFLHNRSYPENVNWRRAPGF